MLKFISGKYQGGEFPLEGDAEIIIGRSSDLDMVLVEDMVSRRHARITSADGQLGIEDFGSTNGTFVNGERITKASLKEGDRILIGTNIIKLVHKDSLEADSESTPPEGIPFPGANFMDGLGDGLSDNAPSGEYNVNHTRTHIVTDYSLQQQRQSMAMSVDLREIPLPDLLQLFSSGKRTGTVLVNSMDEGKLFLREGRLIAACINDDFSVSPYKAFYRILQWSEGHCIFERSEPAFDDEINESIEGLMMEGMRQRDEIENLGGDVPSMHATLFIHQPLDSKLSALSAEQLDVFQMVFNHGRVSTILNKSEESDIEIMRHLIHLIQNDYVHAE